MKKIEKTYFCTSVVIALATLSLFLPKPYVYFIWNSKAHNVPFLLSIFILLSFILGILGVILTLIADKMKRKFDLLVLGIIFSFSFIFSASHVFNLHILRAFGF